MRDDAAGIDILRDLVNILSDPVFVRCPPVRQRQGWVPVMVWSKDLRRIGRLVQAGKKATS